MILIFGDVMLVFLWPSSNKICLGRLKKNSAQKPDQGYYAFFHFAAQSFLKCFDKKV